MAHTRGKWEVEERFSDMPENASVWAGGRYLVEDISKADARLIAACPALLEALKDLIVVTEMLLGDGMTESNEPPLLKKARAAIAAAEGE